MVCKYRGARKTYPREKYKLKHVQEPQLLTFGDFQLRVPKDPEIYLTRYYGPDWNKVAQTQDYCHKTRTTVEPVSYPMEKSSMFLPALPFK